jgi:hypothetical protein
VTDWLDDPSLYRQSKPKADNFDDPSLYAPAKPALGDHPGYNFNDSAAQSRALIGSGPLTAAPDMRTPVGAFDSFQRGVHASLDATAALPGLVATPLAMLGDAAHGVVSGKRETGAQDYLLGHGVDPYLREAQGYAIDPETEKQGFGSQLAGAAGTMAPDLLAMMATGGASAETGLVKPLVERSIARQVLDHVGQSVQHSAQSSLVPGAKAGVAQALSHDQSNPLTALSDLASGYEKTVAMNTMPLAAEARPGAGLLEQALTRGAQGAVAMPAVSGTLATLEGQPYSLENAGVDAAMGGLMAQLGGGEQAPHDLRAPDAVGKPVVDAPASTAIDPSILAAGNANLGDPVEARRARAEAGMQRGGLVPPDAHAAVASILDGLGVAPDHPVAQTLLGDQAPAVDPHAAYRRPEPAPEVSQEPAVAQNPYAQQVAASMRQRAQEQAAQATRTTSEPVQSPTDQPAPAPVGGDLVAKLPPHLQALAAKLDAAGFGHAAGIDRTPEGYGPGVPDENGVDRNPVVHQTTEQQAAQRSINEAQTLLKGKMPADKRAGIERGLASSQARLERANAAAAEPASAPFAKTKPARAPMTVLHVLAKQGLNRAAWKAQGADPAAFTERAGFHYVFRKEGGLTPDGAREVLQQEGFLPADHPDMPATVDDNDAIDLVMRALSGETIHSMHDAEATATQRFQEHADREQAQAEWDQRVGADYPDVAPEDYHKVDALAAVAERAKAAGVDEFDIAPFSNEADTDYIARLQREITQHEARNGNEHAANEAGGSRGIRGQADVAPESHVSPTPAHADAGAADLAGHQSAPAEAAQGRGRGPDTGLFGNPTAREQADGLSRAKDAARDGKTGTGRTDMAAGAGELFAGKRPEQAQVPDAKTAPKADALESTDAQPAHDLTDTDLTPAERASFDRQSIDRPGLRADLSRQQGSADADANGLRTAVAKVLGPIGAKVEYLRGRDGLPADMRSDLQSRNTGRKVQTAALYDPTSKRVYLFTDVVTDPTRAAWHTAHEIAGHQGLRGLFQDHAGLTHALDIARQNPTISKLADAIASERKSTDHLLMTEEALAELAAATRTGNYDEIASRYKIEVPEAMRATLKGAVTRFVQRLKALFEKQGAGFSDADVHGLIENAWKSAQHDGASSKAAPLESVDVAAPEPKRKAADAITRAIANHIVNPDGSLAEHMSAFTGEHWTQADVDNAKPLFDALMQHPAVVEALKAKDAPATNDPQRTTGIKHAVVDAERAAKGQDEATYDGKRSSPDAWARATKMLADDPSAGDHLALSVAAHSRPLSAEENFVLIQDRMRIKNEHRQAVADAAQAMQAKDTYAEEVARVRMAKLEGALEVNDKAARASGYEQGFGLASRRMMSNADYSLADMVTRAKVAAGRDLKAGERERVEAMAARIKELEDQIAATQTRRRASRRTTVPGDARATAMGNFTRLSQQLKAIRSKEQMVEGCRA